MELLNQGIGGLNTPLGQLGTSLLAQSGPQAGNPSGGARLGQALQGMSEMQRAQALQAHRNQQDQLAAQYQQMQLQQYQAKAEQQQRQQAAFQNPALQAQLGPMAKALSAAGIDPSLILKANSGDALQAHRAAQLAQDQNQFDVRQAHIGVGVGGGGGEPSGPKAPTPRQLIIEPLENNMLQKHLYDATSNSYKPYGRPYPAFAPGKATTGAEAVVDQVAPDPQADLSQLPGGGRLQSYAPQAPAPAPLMIGAGANPHARPAATNTKTAATGDLAAAVAAVGRGAPRDAVIARLTQSGYSAAQIKAAGL
jgi:hypothetical protein